MNSWLESLESAVDDSILNQYDEIYYLNSKLVLPVDKLDKIVSDLKLNEFLSKEDPE